MGSNRPLTKEEWKLYWETVEKQEKREYLRTRTYTVLFKVLCNSCSFNAERGKRITYNCPNCRIITWHNCSIRQVENGEIQRKLMEKYPTVEWIKADGADRTLKKQWKRHEARYEQDTTGRWVPKQ